MNHLTCLGWIKKYRSCMEFYFDIPVLVLLLRSTNTTQIRRVQHQHNTNKYNYIESCNFFKLAYHYCIMSSCFYLCFTILSLLFEVEFSVGTLGLLMSLACLLLVVSLLQIFHRQLVSLKHSVDACQNMFQQSLECFGGHFLRLHVDSIGCLPPACVSLFGLLFGAVV